MLCCMELQPVVFSSCSMCRTLQHESFFRRRDGLTLSHYWNSCTGFWPNRELTTSWLYWPTRYTAPPCLSTSTTTSDLSIYAPSPFFHHALTAQTDNQNSVCWLHCTLHWTFCLEFHKQLHWFVGSFYCASICEGGLGSRNSVYPSVSLSVTRVHCDKTKWRTADIFIPLERAITPLLWYQEWLVGDALFPLKSAFKVTHPPSKNADFDRFPVITSQPYEIAKKVQLRRI